MTYHEPLERLKAGMFRPRAGTMEEHDAYDDACDALRDLEARLEESEAYAKEGWDWLDEALAALGVETVFEIKDAKARLERAERLLIAHHAVGALDGLLPGDTCPVCDALPVETQERDPKERVEGSDGSTA